MKVLPLLLASLFALPLFAAEAHPAKGKLPPQPPPLDTASCKGKAVGTVVQITSPDGRSMTASCQLVALPDRPAGPPPGEPVAQPQ